MLKNHGRNINRETPAQEMQRLIRVIAGKQIAGEKDDQWRARAARRMDITPSRARVFWYGLTENIRSDEMDTARELAFVQPIHAAEEAIRDAETFLEGLRSRLAKSAGLAVRDGGAGRGEDHPRRVVGLEEARDRLPSGFPAPLTHSLSMT